MGGRENRVALPFGLILDVHMHCAEWGLDHLKRTTVYNSVLPTSKSTQCKKVNESFIMIPSLMWPPPRAQSPAPRPPILTCAAAGCRPYRHVAACITGMRLSRTFMTSAQPVRDCTLGRGRELLSGPSSELLTTSTYGRNRGRAAHWVGAGSCCLAPPPPQFPTLACPGSEHGLRMDNATYSLPHVHVWVQHLLLLMPSDPPPPAHSLTHLHSQAQNPGLKNTRAQNIDCCLHPPACLGPAPPPEGPAGRWLQWPQSPDSCSAHC